MLCDDGLLVDCDGLLADCDGLLADCDGLLADCEALLDELFSGRATLSLLPPFDRAAVERLLLSLLCTAFSLL